MAIPWTKLIKFLSSAGATGLIYIGVLFVFNTLLHTNPYVSVSVAYIAAMTFYFITNKLLVFKSTSKSALKRQIIQFAIMAAINYVITLLIVALLQKFTGEVYSGSIVAGIVTTVLAYFVFERILFKEKPEEKRA